MKGALKPTLAIMVITICSFMLNFPGLRLQVYPKVVNRRVGRTLSRSLPAGKALHTTIHQLSFVGSYDRRNAQQLGNVSGNADARGANAEELVDKAASTDEYGADKPGTERAGGHIGVIVVVDDSADLSVGRVLQGSHKTLAHTAKSRSTLTTMIRALSILSSW